MQITYAACSTNVLITKNSILWYEPSIGNWQRTLKDTCHSMYFEELTIKGIMVEEKQERRSSSALNIMKSRGPLKTDLTGKMSHP